MLNISPPINLVVLLTLDWPFYKKSRSEKFETGQEFEVNQKDVIMF